MMVNDFILHLLLMMMLLYVTDVPAGSVDTKNDNDMCHVKNAKKQWETGRFHPNPLPESMQSNYVQLSGTKVPRTKPEDYRNLMKNLAKILSLLMSLNIWNSVLISSDWRAPHLCKSHPSHYSVPQIKNLQLVQPLAPPTLASQSCEGTTVRLQDLLLSDSIVLWCPAVLGIQRIFLRNPVDNDHQQRWPQVQLGMCHPKTVNSSGLGGNWKEHTQTMKLTAWHLHTQSQNVFLLQYISEFGLLDIDLVFLVSAKRYRDVSRHGGCNQWTNSAGARP